MTLQGRSADGTGIYWGDPLIGPDSDTRSFLSAHGCGSRRTSSLLDELVERVAEVDRNPDLLQAMLARPWLSNNRVPRCVDPDVMLDRFKLIIETPIDPVARRRDAARLARPYRVPDAVGSIRRRLLRKYRQWTCDAR